MCTINCHVPLKASLIPRLLPSFLDHCPVNCSVKNGGHENKANIPSKVCVEYCHAFFFTQYQFEGLTMLVKWY